MKILLAVDGSPISTRATKHAIKLMRLFAEPSHLVLFHADPPLLQAAAVKLGIEAVQRYHAENNRFAIKAAHAALTRAQVPFTEMLVVAEPAEAIVKQAKKGRFDLIVMGTHGRSALKGLLLGSVAGKVIAHGETPVTVVR
jgi:nucleotide-binding universal stress UspA family protein